ncbi:MAG: MMPL family transporter [Treponema sp.]|jgi:predicted RND superfamily exporter protein|nr:MMPL family transporter [Treponema sp.]
MEKIFKHPRLIVAIIGGITVFFAVQLFRIELDNNNFRFVPKNDQARLVSQYIDDTFGSSTFILVGLERKYGTVFDRDFLNRIKEYVDQIKEIDYVGEVNSLMTSDYITGDKDTLRVEKLVEEDFSGTPEEIRELKRRMLSWDMYRRALISDDFTATQILVPLDITLDDAGAPEAVNSFLKIRDKAREMFDGLAEVYVTGMPVISATINEAVKADLMLLVPLVIFVVLVIVFIPLRRISFVALSLLSVVVAVIWSIGAMPLFGIKLSVISTVLPVILIAVGSSYGLHLIIHYIEDSEVDFGAMTKEKHRVFILNLIRKIGKPLVLAALTTMVSFLSFCFTQVLPIREFGYFSGFGVISSFVITITLIPSILIIRGPKPLRKLRIKAPKSKADSSANKHIAGCFARVVKKKRLIIFAAAVLMGVSIYGASKVVIDNVFVEYFKPHTDIYRSEGFIREQFGGSKVISIVVQAESPEIVLHPDTLSAVDKLNTYLSQQVPEVGKVTGFTDLIKRINQVFNADESPEGLKPAAIRDSGNFGFGDFNGPGNADFGFGGMDNDSFDFQDETPPRAGPEIPEQPYTPRELAALLERAASSGRDRGMNAADLVWEVKKLVNYEGAAYYEIPSDPARYGKTGPEELQRLVSNYLVLLSGNITSYSNDPLEPTAIKTTVQLRTVGQADTEQAVEEMFKFVKTNFPKNVQVIIGGGALVEASLNNLVVHSLWTSMIIALSFLFGIITVCNRSFMAGLISSAPLVLLILINFAVMGLLGIKLNIGTAMISSLTMGIGIDYTIHYIEAYKREYRASGGKGDFLKKAYSTSGIAIIVDAVSVGAGFGALLLSQFNMLADLGLLITLAMLMSALVGLVVVPALLMLINPRFVKE